MRRWRSLIRARLGGVTADGGREAEIVEELAQHLQQVYREALASGASKAEARRRALRQLDDPARLARELRRAVAPLGGRLAHGPAAAAHAAVTGVGLGGSGLVGLGQDLRHGLRRLIAVPGFTLAVVVTLGLGIGACTAIFSVVHGVLLQPLRYESPDRLAMIQIDAEGFQSIAAVSAPELEDLREQADLFEGFGGLWGTTGALTDGDEPEHVRYAWVTANLFPLLGAPPLLGRHFREQEDRPGSGEVVILGEGLWRRRYGADPAIVGKQVELDDAPRTVVGVMPAGLKLPSGAIEIVLEDYDAWIPQTFWTNRELRWLRVVGRVRQGVPFAHAQQQVDGIVDRLQSRYAEYDNTRIRMHVVPLKDALVGSVRPMVLALAGAVGFVLLIACANAASLLLARSKVRETELAVRAALGAGPGRIVRQMLVESLLLSVLAGSAGLLLAAWGVQALLALRPPDLPRLDEISVDGTVLLAALAASVATGLLFGLAPVAQVLKLDLAEMLRGGGRIGGARGGSRLRSLLVVAEVALSVVLLVGAGLMIRTFFNLRQVDPGFRPDGVLTFRMPIAAQSHMSGDSRWSYYRLLKEQLEALPGVQASGGASLVPLGGGLRTGPFAYDAATEESWGELSADYRTVVPGYFETVRARLVAGRGFDDADAAGKRRVIVVDEKLARRAWPGETAVGKRVKLLLNPGGNEEIVDWAEVIGVVAHIRHDDLRRDGSPQIYRPFWLENPVFMTMTVRTAAEPMTLVPAIREVIGRMGAGRPVHTFRVLDGYVSDALSGPRLTLVLMGLFAGLAVILATVGLYGVLAYSVSQRTREFGLRMALGAGRRSIFGLVLGSGMGLTLAGTLLGCAGALAVTRFLEGLLFGVEPTDPAVFAGFAALLGGVALLACLLPARRATRVDPLVALREG